MPRRTARETLTAAVLPDVVGHLDWRVQNLAFTDDQVSAIFDWDSVALVPEAALVGNTSVIHPIDWRLERPDPLPTLAQLDGFVADYEARRGAPFSVHEHEVLTAGQRWIASYGARCQRSDDLLGIFPDVDHSAAGRASSASSSIGSASPIGRVATRLTAMELALVSLGDHLADPATGVRSTPTEKFRLVVDHAVRAEEVGFDAVMLGEHHYCDYILSSPQVVLGGIATRTERLRLNTGVTLLPTLDPVRVAEDFTSLDVLSGGRAEITVGRGILPSAYDAVDRPIGSSREIFAESTALLAAPPRRGEGDVVGTLATSARRRHHRAEVGAAAAPVRSGSPAAARRRRSTSQPTSAPA